MTFDWREPLKLGLKWFDDMVEFNPLKDISNFTGNILVLYGDKDVVVPPEINELVLDAYEKSTGLIMLGADQGYGFYSNQPDVTELVEDKFAEFFRENLK